MSTRRATDAALRLCKIMAMLPRAPRKIAARTIVERLGSDGYPVTIRTVERDLQKLRSEFPVTVDEGHKPYGWSFLREARGWFGE